MLSKWLFFILLPLSLYAAKPSVQDQYSTLIQANDRGEWKELIAVSEDLLKTHSDSPFAKEAVYYIGIGYFNLGDYEWANRYFSDYLKNQSSPKHFEGAIQHKFEIAQKFKNGSKKHLFSTKMLPQWMPAQSDAVGIYDEVIAALPHHDLAANALYDKAQLLADDEDFRGSIESYQTLIRRFPKHPLSAESYIGIGQVYLKQSEVEFPDPDFLDLAEINLRKFRANLPRSEKLGLAEGIFAKMQERYANNLFEIGRFYERTSKYSAAVIYYSKVLSSFPQAPTSERAKQRMEIAKLKLAKQEKK